MPLAFNLHDSHRKLHHDWEKWLMDHKITPPWKDITVPTRLLPPSPEKLRAVINDLDVENAPRYQPSSYGTYCNIFATDVLAAMGFPPSHWVNPDDGSPSEMGKGQELTANLMARWFTKFGAAQGWVDADRQTATDAAARGHLVVVIWDSQGKGPGHVAIMLPEGTIAQAGAENFVGKTIREGFGNRPVKFWVQSHGGKHNP